LPHQLLFGRQLWDQAPEWIEFWSRREVNDVLHLSHERHLVRAVRDVLPLAGRAHVITIEVCSVLLELREVFHRAQGALGAVDLLIEHATQTGRVQPESHCLRSQVRRQVESRIAVEVGVTVEAGNSSTLLGYLAILGLIELFLGNGVSRMRNPSICTGVSRPFMIS